MKGAAPKRSKTGSHTDVVRNEKPYRRIDARASRNRSRISATRSSKTDAAVTVTDASNARSARFVPPRPISVRDGMARSATVIAPRSTCDSSAREGCLAGYGDALDHGFGPLHDGVWQGGIAEIGVELLAIMRGPPEHARHCNGF